MAEPLLTQPQIEEALSRSYLRALAGRAGFITAEYDFDMAGIDMQVRAGPAAEQRVLEVQLKATVNLGPVRDGAFRFRLDGRNYDVLRRVQAIPAILVVLDLPSDPEQWLVVTDDALLIRQLAYWVSLAGAPPRGRSASVTVRIPSRNVLDLATLQALVDGDMSGGHQ